MATRSAVTIGTFDGVHRGHAALALCARDFARAHAGRAIALVFDPHPLSRLRPEAAPPPISTFEQRARWLTQLGIDEVVRLEPTPDRLAQPPEAFIDEIVERFNPELFVEGPDFRFGKARAGDVRTLADAGRARPEPERFAVEVIEPVEVALDNHTLARASSTLVRWLVAHGRVTDAARVLGRPYELAGTVVQGDRRGRTIGYPTANLDTRLLTPADGVYAGRATLPDRRTFPCAISVGTKPQFGGRVRAVEAHLLDTPDRAGTTNHDAIDGLDEYGWTLRITFATYLRDQARFPSVDELLEQMARDCDRAQRLADTPASNGAPA